MNYSILIEWSEVDRRYLVTISEFSELVMQPCTSRITYTDALDNAQDCISACLEYCKQKGIIPPTPAIVGVA